MWNWQEILKTYSASLWNKVAGLGGNPYRDGSFAYYMSEPIVSDDFKGSGPFMLALCEALGEGLAR